MTAAAAKVVKSTTIEVDLTKPPAEGKREAKVKAKDGSWWGVFPEKMGLLRPGHVYEVEYSERQWNDNTYRTIVKVKPVANAMAPIEQERSRQSAPSIDKSTNQEFEFITRVLCSMVQHGHVTQSEEELAKAAQMLRGAYRRIFGS